MCCSKSTLTLLSLKIASNACRSRAANSTNANRQSSLTWCEKETIDVRDGFGTGGHGAYWGALADQRDDTNDGPEVSSEQSPRRAENRKRRAAAVQFPRVDSRRFAVSDLGSSRARYFGVEIRTLRNRMPPV